MLNVIDATQFSRPIAASPYDAGAISLLFSSDILSMQILSIIATKLWAILGISILECLAIARLVLAVSWLVAAEISLDDYLSLISVSNSSDLTSAPINTNTMDLNFTSAIEALNSMNYTADCSTSVRWLEAQGSELSDPDGWINIAFLQAALPVGFDSLSNLTLSSLYKSLETARPSIWYEPAIETIQAGYLAPQLATALSVRELNLTANCSTTVSFYSNTLCAINGPQSGWTVGNLGNSKWIVSDSFSKPLNNTSGLAMLRSSLPSQYSNISDVELATWSSLSIEQMADFPNNAQLALICDVCLKEFCIAAAFTGNPDIAGIGAMVSYVMGACLVTISLLYWSIKATADWYHGTSTPESPGPFQIVASDTIRSLFGGAFALALSLSLAFFVLFVRGSSSYYEELMADNATFIATYILVILGINFPLSSFRGIEFATKGMTLYYLITWIQLFGTLALVNSFSDGYDDIEYGDEPCLQSQLGGSPSNNPIVYSILFLVVAGTSRLFLILSFTFKALGGWFRVYRSWRKSRPSDSEHAKERRSIRALQLFSEAETMSLLLSSPLFHTGVGLVTGLLMIYLIYDIFTNRSLDGENPRELADHFYERIPDIMDVCFEKASYCAYFLSVLSLPLMWLDVAFILRVRHAMSTIAGGSWIENQVGFGQILALLLWMPVVGGFALSLSSSNYSR